MVTEPYQAALRRTSEYLPDSMALYRRHSSDSMQAASIGMIQNPSESYLTRQVNLGDPLQSMSTDYNSVANDNARPLAEYATLNPVAKPGYHLLDLDKVA